MATFGNRRKLLQERQETFHQRTGEHSLPYREEGGIQATPKQSLRDRLINAVRGTPKAIDTGVGKAAELVRNIKQSNTAKVTGDIAKKVFNPPSQKKGKKQPQIDVRGSNNTGISMGSWSGSGSAKKGGKKKKETYSSWMP